MLLGFFCLSLTAFAQEKTESDRIYASLQLGAAPMAELRGYYDPDFYTFRDFISVYRPTVGLSVGRKFKRFRLEGGLEYFQFELADQRHTETVDNKFYLYQYNTQGFLLAVPVLARWHFGKKKLRLGLDAGMQLFFMQHRISEGTSSSIDFSSFPLPASEPYKKIESSFLLGPLPRIATGFNYVPNDRWEFGMRFGLIGIPGLSLIGYSQLLVVRPF